MKTLKNIMGMLLMAAAAITFYACGEDEPEYMVTDPEDEGKMIISFAGDLAETVEVEPGTAGFDLTLQRSDDSAEATVKIKVRSDEANMFAVPETATFAKGSKETSITITPKNPVEGTYYDLSLTLEGELSDYAVGTRDKNISFAVLKWESIGDGFWEGNLVNTFFGVDVHVYKVNIEKAITPTDMRFRFVSPYSKAFWDAAGENPIGTYGYIDAEEKYEWFGEFFDNFAGDVLPGDFKFLITVAGEKNEAFMPDTPMGMDWSYGGFSTGMMKDKDPEKSYPNGKFNKDKNYIEFPAKSLYCGMADYGAAPAGLCRLYLNAQAYIDAQPKDVDYANEYTWTKVEGADGTFESEVQDKSWTQIVEGGVKIGSESKEPEYYRLPNLYKEGFHLVYAVDEDGIISMPKRQDTGLISLGNKSVYMDLVAGSISEDNVYSFQLKFYTVTVTEDGEEENVIGTMTEVFNYGKVTPEPEPLPDE